MVKRCLFVFGVMFCAASEASFMDVSEDFFLKMSGDKVLCDCSRGGAAYAPGSIWFREGESGCCLFYRLEYDGGDCMRSCLCYNFEDNFFGWPKNWSGALKTLENFCFLNEGGLPFGGFVRNDVDYVDGVVRAVLSGAQADFNGGEWFAWKRVCDHQYIAVAEGDTLLEGTRVNGVYGKSSAWLCGERGARVLRYRSQEDIVFQFAPAARNRLDALFLKLFCFEEDLDAQWSRVVHGFILREERVGLNRLGCGRKASAV